VIYGSHQPAPYGRKYPYPVSPITEGWCCFDPPSLVHSDMFCLLQFKAQLHSFSLCNCTLLGQTFIVQGI